MRDLRRLLFYLKPHWGKFALATVAMLFVGLLQSAIGALIVPIFDQALRQSGDDSQRTPTLFGLQHVIPDSGFEAWRTIAVLLVGFTIAKGVAEYFSTYLMARVGQESVLKLRTDMYSHLHAQSADFFERHRTNYLVSRLVGSAAAIETAVSNTLRDMLRESFTLVCFLTASFYYSWRLTLGSLAIAPLIGFLTARFGRSLRNLARESYEGNQQLVDTAQEALSNQTIVKAYVAEGRERGRFERVARQIMRANLRTAKIHGIAPNIIELIGVLAVAALLFFAQREILSGRMNAALFITFLFFLFSSYDPMRKLSRLHNGMEQALAAARHVWEVMDERAEMPEKPNAVALRPLADAIELKSVVFGYGNEERRVLRDISLRIPAGRMVALVGESGGGKSTLTKLVPRFHDPTEGAVLWDGVDLRDATLASLRGHIALVTQETVLFNDTVRYNISYSRPDATEAEIEAAARVALRARLHHGAAARLRHGGRRARHLPLGRPAAAARHRPRRARGRLCACPRRGDLGARCRVRAPRPEGAREPDPRAHDHRHRAPALDRAPRRPDRRHRARPHRRDRPPLRAARARRRLPTALRTAIRRRGGG